MTAARWAVVLTGAALLLLAAPPVWGQSDNAHGPRQQQVVTTAFTPNGLPGDTVAERTAQYRRLAEIGVDAIRLDMTWTDVEPVGPPLHDHDFTQLDREVEAITDAGLQVIGLLAYGHPDHSAVGGAMEDSPTEGRGLPPFGIGSSHYVPPDDPADFATYAAAVAGHYGDEVIAWEVWNEQNEGWRFWFPREDPAAYADLLCATYEAVTAIDSGTPVVFGGVFFPAVPPGLPGMSGPQFVEAAYDARPDLGDCFDVLAYHPYPYPFTAPELEVPIRGSVLSASDAMRGAMPPADRDRPLWITEIGWPNNDGYGVDEAKQAQYVARMQVATAAQGLPLINWYTFGDTDDPTGVNQEAHFGFFRADGSAKPAVAALATATDLLDGARFVADRSDELGMPDGQELVSGGGFAYEFSRPGVEVTVLWYANESAAEAQGPTADGGTVAGEAITVTLPVDAPRVRIVDHLGEQRTVETPNGQLELTVGPSPQYVIVAGGAPSGPPVDPEAAASPWARGALPTTGGGVALGAIILIGAALRLARTRMPLGSAVATRVSDRAVRRCSSRNDHGGSRQAAGHVTDDTTGDGRSRRNRWAKTTASGVPGPSPTVQERSTGWSSTAWIPPTPTIVVCSSSPNTPISPRRWSVERTRR